MTQLVVVVFSRDGWACAREGMRRGGCAGSPAATGNYRRESVMRRNSGLVIACGADDIQGDHGEGGGGACGVEEG